MRNVLTFAARKALSWAQHVGESVTSGRKEESKAEKKNVAKQWQPFTLSSTRMPRLSPANKASHINAAYHNNPVVYSAVNFIARTLGSVHLRVLKGKERVEDTHALGKLLQRPNSQQGWPSFFSSLITYMLLSGNGFIYATQANKQGNPLELHILRPDRVSLSLDERGFPLSYAYGHERFYCKQTPCPIAHLKFFNPMDPYYGMSPLSPAQSMIDLYNAITEYHLKSIQTYGIPKAILTFKDMYLTPEQRRELTKQLEEFKEREGAYLILDGSAQFEMANSGMPQKMDFESTKAELTKSILGTLNLMSKHMGDTSFSDRDQVSLHLWENTLIPLLEFFVAELKRYLLPFYAEPDLTIEFSLDDIPAMTARQKEWWQFLDKLNCFTTEEKRAMSGLA